MMNDELKPFARRKDAGNDVDFLRWFNNELKIDRLFSSWQTDQMIVSLLFPSIPSCHSVNKDCWLNWFRLLRRLFTCREKCTFTKMHSERLSFGEEIPVRNHSHHCNLRVSPEIELERTDRLSTCIWFKRDEQHPSAEAPDSSQRTSVFSRQKDEECKKKSTNEGSTKPLSSRLDGNPTSISYIRFDPTLIGSHSRVDPSIIGSGTAKSITRDSS